MSIRKLIGFPLLRVLAGAPARAQNINAAGRRSLTHSIRSGLTSTAGCIPTFRESSEWQSTAGKILLTSAQQYCEGLAYARLPKEVVVKEQKAIVMIQ